MGAQRDFDIDGANWVDFTTFGSIYEEQLDVSRTSGLWRHRIRAIGDEPHDPWREGRAPCAPSLSSSS